jgi:hypothetical protein
MHGVREFQNAGAGEAIVDVGRAELQDADAVMNL